MLETAKVENAVLIGHSTGGGEIAHYASRHGTARIAKMVFVGAVPWLLHIPVKETDNGPQPAGDAVKLLEGFAWQDTHEMLNTFTWGPDGWLYGCHGVFTHSHVKVVGAPDSERQFINAGVWRYHPTKKRFEVFAEGTSNPWGIDFNEFGHCFIEACVIPHLFHMIQGGR